jgi:hypothetical protein
LETLAKLTVELEELRSKSARQMPRAREQARRLGGVNTAISDAEATGQ